jgi:hypothetical protein
LKVDNIHLNKQSLKFKPCRYPVRIYGFDRRYSGIVSNEYNCTCLDLVSDGYDLSDSRYSRFRTISLRIQSTKKRTIVDY